MGRKWITKAPLLPLSENNEATVNKLYEYWTTRPGYSLELMDGIMIDEFEGSDQPIYDAYRKVLSKITADPRFQNKMFVPYAMEIWASERSKAFFRDVIASGGKPYSENYLTESPTEAGIAPQLDRISRYYVEWERNMPGITPQAGMTLCYHSAPTISHNNYPGCDFRKFLDMQIRHIATHPAFFGLGGLQEYHSGYCDEETVRLMGRLYRHYAIEGNIEPLITDPYELTHIANPDFADGTDAWTVSAAEPGSVKVIAYEGYSRLQGRFGHKAANTLLLMKRHASRPNSFSQQIRDLTPGRLYSMKMITADHQNLVQGKSEKVKNAVNITLGNVDIIPGPKKSFQYTFPNSYAHRLGKFNKVHKYWMN